MGSVTVTDDVDDATWDALVEQSAQGTPFHYAGALDVAAEHAGATLHRLVGYVGQEPVGVFPVFEKRKGPATVAFSPPPGLKLTYLGPALVNLAKLKDAKRERRHRRFVEACIDHVESAADPRYVHVRTGPTYGDPRPFSWNGFDVTPGFTYVVDVEADPETLRNRFSRDARTNVRDCEDAGCAVRIGGEDAVAYIVDRVVERHEEQDEDFPASREFVRDLCRALPEGRVRPYLCELDGDVVGGNLVLDDGTRAYSWQGVAKPDVDVPVNALLHWRAMVDASERGATGYDLIGAENERLAEYKSKFGPSIERYNRAERGTAVMTAAAALYKRFG